MSSREHEDIAESGTLFSTKSYDESANLLSSTDVSNQSKTSDTLTLGVKTKSNSKKPSSLPKLVSLHSNKTSKQDPSINIKQKPRTTSKSDKSKHQQKEEQSITCTDTDVSTDREKGNTEQINNLSPKRAQIKSVDSTPCSSNDNLIQSVDSTSLSFANLSSSVNIPKTVGSNFQIEGPDILTDEGNVQYKIPIEEIETPNIPDTVTDTNCKIDNDKCGLTNSCSSIEQSQEIVFESVDRCRSVSKTLVSKSNKKSAVNVTSRKNKSVILSDNNGKRVENGVFTGIKEKLAESGVLSGGRDRLTESCVFSGSNDKLAESGVLSSSKDKLTESGVLSGSKDKLVESGVLSGSKDKRTESGILSGNKDKVAESGVLSGRKDKLTESGVLSGSKDKLTECGVLSGSKDKLTESGVLASSKDKLTESGVLSGSKDKLTKSGVLSGSKDKPTESCFLFGSKVNRTESGVFSGSKENKTENKISSSSRSKRSKSENLSVSKNKRIESVVLNASNITKIEIIESTTSSGKRIKNMVVSDNNDKRPDRGVLSNNSSRTSTSIAKEQQSRARRRLSFLTETSPLSPGRPGKQPTAQVSHSDTPTKRVYESSSSVDSLKNLNLELREQVAKLRYQLDAHKGSIKQAHWQKVVDVRHLRQRDSERLALALAEQKEKLDKEKVRDLDNQREQLVAKAESDLQKLARHKDVEIIKLKQEISCKDVMVQRLLGENRHAALKLNIDVRRSKLLDDIKDLRRQKKELEDSLSSATLAERTFSDDLRRHTQNFEAEIAKVRRDSQLENKHLIEQLKNKDKLISQLEKDLGQQWVAAHLAALERECSEGARGYAMSAPSHPLSPLPEACYDPSFYPWDPTSTPATGGVEEAKPNAVESNTPGKEDLLKRLRDDKDKKKELVEKCRTYLQRIKELTAQNRAYKDSSEKVLQENKKMQELHEHSKLRVLQLTRNLSEAQAEKTNLERQIEKVEELRQQMMEDKKTINALKQACNNKDRRIELMQHRKKKRQLAEKTMGVKETFFGYEEDTNSVDSEQSSSSMSQSTISDDDVWNEVLTAEETERNYQRLMMEHLRLQKSHTQLHSQCGHLQDPQREAMVSGGMLVMEF